MPAASPPLLHLTDIRLRIGRTQLLDGAELAVAPGERVALVGRNGSGKSTLLRVATGEAAPDSGTRFVQPGATLRALAQEPDFGAAASVLEHVEAGLAPGDDPHRARRLLERLGLTGEEHPARLSGGEARRAALARALAPDPDILLLDEPTNHLDLPAIAWLEEELAGFRGALVVISHDRRFLSRVSRAMVWLDRGTTRRLDQGFSAFEEWRDRVLEEEERELHKLDRKIVREEHWMRYGVTARRKRNVRRVGELAELRRRKREAIRPVGGAPMAASEAERGGTAVLVAEGIEKSYGEERIVRAFSTRILRGDRVGLIGPNGAGKTTLLKMLTGELAPDAGSVRLGAGLAMATLDQTRAALDPALGVAETLTGAPAGGGGDSVQVGAERRHVVGYLKEFLFGAEQARQPVSALSGGERARLLLAKLLARPSNLLVLDEPTNDLDLETLDLLEEMLADYAGTLLVVSHDRDFLDRVCTSVIVAEGGGRWGEYAGGYSDMLAQRGAGVGAKPEAGATPGRGARAAAPDAPPRLSPPARPRLSPKEQHLLAALPERMASLGAEIEKLQQALAAPDLYTRDRARFDRFTAALAERQAALAEAEEEWLALELRREALERA